MRLAVVGIGMVVTPTPVVLLLILVQLVVVAILFVALIQIHAKGGVFVAIPTMIIRVVFIVNANTASASGNCRGQQESTRKNCGAKNRFVFEHDGFPP